MGRGLSGRWKSHFGIVSSSDYPEKITDQFAKVLYEFRFRLLRRRERRTSTSTFTQLFSSERRPFSCCFPSTETIRLIRDRPARTATSTFTQLLLSCKSGDRLACPICSHADTYSATDSGVGRRRQVVNAELQSQMTVAG